MAKSTPAKPVVIPGKTGTIGTKPFSGLVVTKKS